MIFEHYGREMEKRKGEVAFEERVVLLRARSADHAIELAEISAKRYARGLQNCRYIKFVDVFRIFEPQIGHGSEVYSLMRRSRQTASAYLDKFYDTGKECTGGA